MTPSRRRFLAVSGAAAVALGLAGVGLGLRPTTQRAPRRALQALDATSFSILAAAAARICPGSEGLPDAWALEVPENIDAYLATVHPATRDEVVQALAFLENPLPALFLEGRVTPFTGADAAAQDAVLRAFATSRIGLRRTVYKALVSLVTSTYWGDPRVLAYTGYEPLRLR